MKPYYSDEKSGIYIYNADCRDVLPIYPQADMILTSPPYDDLRAYGGFSFDFHAIAQKIKQSMAEGGGIGVGRW